MNSIYLQNACSRRRGREGAAAPSRRAAGWTDRLGGLRLEQTVQVTLCTLHSLHLTVRSFIRSRTRLFLFLFPSHLHFQSSYWFHFLYEQLHFLTPSAPGFVCCWVLENLSLLNFSRRKCTQFITSVFCFWIQQFYYLHRNLYPKHVFRPQPFFISSRVFFVFALTEFLLERELPLPSHSLYLL